jgi:hypothetical protein
MLTAEQSNAAAAVQASLVAQGVDRSRAAVLVRRAVGRASVCAGGCGDCTNCCCCSKGLGATAPPIATPSAITAGTPQLISTIDTAGDNPTVAAVRDIVGKWSWLIPVGGLLMSAKSKVTAWHAAKTDPAYAASKSLRRR